MTKYKEILSKETKDTATYKKTDSRKQKCCEHATMVNSLRKGNEGDSSVIDCELNGTSKCRNRNLVHNEWERIQN